MNQFRDEPGWNNNYLFFREFRYQLLGNYLNLLINNIKFKSTFKCAWRVFMRPKKYSTSKKYLLME